MISKLRWYWSRLQCMSMGEIQYRVSHLARDVLMPFRVNRSRVVPGARDVDCALHWVPGRLTENEGLISVANRIIDGDLLLFDNLHSSFSERVDWNSDPTGKKYHGVDVQNTLIRQRHFGDFGDIRVLWELNRHHNLVTLAQAFHLTKERKFADEFRRLLTSWFDQCPYPFGPNWSSGLEGGIRLINWSYAWLLLGGGKSILFEGQEGEEFLNRWMSSVYYHLQFILGHLSRFSSANNHLIGELSGIYVACSVWPLWDESEQWRISSISMLEAEVERQIDKDGVDREQTVAYHRFVMEFFLLLRFFSTISGHTDETQKIAECAYKMFDFLNAMVGVNLEVANFGDSDDGAVLRLYPECRDQNLSFVYQLAGVVLNDFQIPDKFSEAWNYVEWFLDEDASDSTISCKNSQRVILQRKFEEAGYYILGQFFETDREVRCIVDAGPLGLKPLSAHGHADALSFVLFVGRNLCLMDPGTYKYHGENDWRGYFRSTRAHNTVCVDAVDQSVSRGAFLWSHQANTRCLEWRTSEVEDYFLGEQDGYTRLDDPVLHQRSIRLDKSADRIRVIDKLQCEKRHSFSVAFHFAPGWEVKIENNIVTAENNHSRLVMEMLGPYKNINKYYADIDTNYGWYSSGFLRKGPCNTVIISGEISESAEIHTDMHIVFK